SAADLAAGRFEPLSNAVAARPSGTEPKIKYYLYASEKPASGAFSEEELAAMRASQAMTERAIELACRLVASASAGVGGSTLRQSQP
ncbi:MAG: hypothetical protein EBZ55_06725, partial [Actinobacteria bacterium]|nr:hypothetical protein [Actinomycetota bacterium]